MSEEPYGHRGHPSAAEAVKAARARNSLGLLLAQLSDQGFTVSESMAFVSATAYEIGLGKEECWFDLHGARMTVENVFLGKAAKFWSIGLIDQAITTIKEMML